MARKDRTFASKVAKAALKDSLAKHCNVCGEIVNVVQLVSSEKSETGNYKFKEKFVEVCKCNQKEIYS